jgi:7-carboxy-7-deazaguanine synthase
MQSVKVAEIYKSIQGEGLFSGTESVFVRTSGCNLRCWFCDTPYASWNPEGRDLAVGDVVTQVAEWDTRHVVLTGGEPMLYSELIPLADQLRSAGRHVTIETAGTLYLPVTCDLMSISPKLSNSTPSRRDHTAWYHRHEATRERKDVIRQLVAEHVYQMKFVIDRPEDCDEVEAYLDGLPEIDRSRVMLMPQGKDIEALGLINPWLQAYCDDHDLLFCPRRHIELFGLTRGT